MLDMYVDSQRQAIASTPGLFLLNPSANRKFVMGEKPRIGNSTIMLISAVIFFLAAAIGTYFLGGDLLRANQAEQSGKAIKALIVDGHLSRSSKGGTSYYITYQFKVNGEIYKKETKISGSLYNNLAIGDTVTIKYLPSDPNTSVLTGDYKDDTARNDNIIILALLLPTCLIIGSLILHVDNSNRRISQGQLLPGQIINAQGRSGSKGSYNVTVEYGFANPYGQQLTKKQTANRTDLRRNPLPEPGTPVTVLYVDDKFFRLM